MARGGAGLCCDADGVALGPLPLVDAVAGASGRRSYHLRPMSQVARALRLAYDAASDDIERWQRGLAKVAELLDAGAVVQAGIRAVLLAFPEIEPAAMAKLAHAAELQKYNPHWPDEAREPAGTPKGGEWAGNGAPSPPARSPYFEPAAAQMTDVQAKKERFVDAHLDAAEKGAAELGIPVENILGLSALESSWGEYHFASEGNNYFGIHYPAPYATGYLRAKRGTAKVATFASYADSLKSFIAISGSIVRGKSDPTAFAAALQNSGKYGIDPDTGAKKPNYVRSVANTIVGLRPIIARRRI